MTALLRPRLPLSADFGNANSLPRGSRAPERGTLARHTVEEIELRLRFFSRSTYESARRLVQRMRQKNSN